MKGKGMNFMIIAMSCIIIFCILFLKIRSDVKKSEKKLILVKERNAQLKDIVLKMSTISSYAGK